MYETLGVTNHFPGGPGTLASLPGHGSLLTKRRPLLCKSLPQLICGLQGGGSESTDTDLCGWPYNTQRC